MNRSNNILIQIASIFFITILVSVMITFLYNQFWISDTFYLYFTQLFAMVLFTLIGAVTANFIPKHTLQYGILIATLYFVLSCLLTFSMHSLFQIAKALCFCFGMIITKGKQIKKSR